MNPIRPYATVHAALQSFPPEKEYTFIRHNLLAGERIDEHFHPAVDEWLLLEDRCEPWIDLAKITVGEGVNLVHLPKGTVHGLAAINSMSYFVLREGNDETYWIKDLLAKRETTPPIADPCGTLWELYNKGNLSVAYVEVTGTAREHRHEKMHETYRVEKGTGELVLNGKPLQFSQGDVCSLQLGQRHFLRKTQGQFEVLVITHPGFDPTDMIFTE